MLKSLPDMSLNTNSLLSTVTSNVLFTIVSFSVVIVSPTFKLLLHPTAPLTSNVEIIVVEPLIVKFSLISTALFKEISPSTITFEFKLTFPSITVSPEISVLLLTTNLFIVASVFTIKLVLIIAFPSICIFLLKDVSQLFSK